MILDVTRRVLAAMRNRRNPDDRHRVAADPIGTTRQHLRGGQFVDMARAP
jgi:hypothetical protein